MLAIGLCGSLFNITHGLPFRVSEGAVQADAARDAGRKGDGECRAVKAPVSIGCAIGSLPHDDKYDFVIWGDSHARHLALAFSEQAAKRGLAGIIVWNAGCGPFLHDTRLSPNCAEANNRTERWIKTQENLKLVFLAGYWASYTNRFLTTADDEPSNGQNRKDGPTGIGDTLRFLQSRNATRWRSPSTNAANAKRLKYFIASANASAFPSSIQLGRFATGMPVASSGTELFSTPTAITSIGPGQNIWALCFVFPGQMLTSKEPG
jgi:hypothetical protein